MHFLLTNDFDCIFIFDKCHFYYLKKKNGKKNLFLMIFAYFDNITTIFKGNSTTKIGYTGFTRII